MTRFAAAGHRRDDQRRPGVLHTAQVADRRQVDQQERHAGQAHPQVDQTLLGHVALGAEQCQHVGSQNEEEGGDSVPAPAATQRDAIV